MTPQSRVYIPGELARELARSESGTSSKFHPPSPSRQCSVQSHSPTNLNAHLLVGLSREKEMPEQDAAIQLNLARSRQEVKCQNNKLHPVTFQNKTLHVDTSTHCEASCLPYCVRRGGLKPQLVGIARRRSKTGSEPQRSGPLSSGNWANSLAILMAKNNTQNANVSIGLIRATHIAKLANLTYLMKITNPSKTN